MTLGVLFIGLAATAGVSFGSARDLQSDRDRRLDAAAERARSAVDARLELHMQNLAQLRDWLLVQPDVTRQQFRAHAALGFEQDLYPGVQAVTYIARVPAAERARFEATARTETDAIDGHPPFVVHPPASGPEGYIVDYVEPVVGNEAVLGYDLVSDASRRQAIGAARDRGNAVGTGPVRLIQEVGDQRGFVLYSAVYDTPSVPQTAPARRRHFSGAVAMSFRLGDMFAGVLGPRPETDIEIYDLGPTEEPPSVRYGDEQLLLDTAPSSTVRTARRVVLQRELDLNIGDRRWRMVVTPASGFAGQIGPLPAVVAGLGVLVSLLLARVVWGTAMARERAERMAVGMTADLRAAEERARSIVAAAPDATLVVGADGRISLVNRAAEVLFGYSATELLGQPIELLVPEDRHDRHTAARRDFQRAPRPRDMGAGLELLARRADGSTFAVEVSLSPLPRADGTTDVIAAARDISVRREEEIALQQAYDHERAAAERLRQADELKTAFLSTVSHELRTPLTAITGFTKLLLAEAWTPEQHDDFLLRIQRNAQGLDALIGDVLAFSRLEREDVVLHPASLQLDALARSIVDQVSPTLGDRVVVVDAPTPVVCFVDPDALTRILTNLLTNAARYSAAGPIAVEVRADGDRAILTVTDEGQGVPVEERDRVFDRFYRGQAALAGGVAGTGVGLAVVRELTERSGGCVQVVDGEGGGARFVVDLPAVADPVTDPGSIADHEQAGPDR